MTTTYEADKVNALIEKNLSAYPGDVASLALEAIHLAEKMSTSEIAEVLKTSIKNHITN